MTRRISARLREEAAVLCAQMATWWHGARDSGCYPRRGDGSAAAWWLAESALHVSISDTYTVRWAEAEAMLRCRWTP